MALLLLLFSTAGLIIETWAHYLMEMEGVVRAILSGVQ